MSSSWPLGLVVTFLAAAILIFGRRFVPEEWRRERRTMTIALLVIYGVTMILVVIAIWLAVFA